MHDLYLTRERAEREGRAAVSSRTARSFNVEFKTRRNPDDRSIEQGFALFLFQPFAGASQPNPYRRVAGHRG